MKIDNKKFVELLVEATGNDEEKIRKQLADLVQEINDSLENGDAYEVEGFGIFTKFGANLSFLPSAELETEINYKYAGMKPLELEDEVSVPDMEEPQEATNGGSNPFAGLIDDEDLEEMDKMEAEQADEAEEEEVVEDEIEAVVEETADDVFGELEEDAAEETIEEPADELEASEEADVEEELETISESDIEDLINASDDLMGTLDAESEAAAEEDAAEEAAAKAEEEEEEAPGPEKWGIDTYKDDNAESVFGSLLGDETESSEIEETEEESGLDEIMGGDDTPEGFEAVEDGTDEIEDMDENPFEEVSFDDLEAGADDETEAAETTSDGAPVIPKITNVSSGIPEADEDPFAHAEETVKEDKKGKKKKDKKKKKSGKQEPASPILLFVVIIVSFGAIGYVAYAFGYLDNIIGKKPPQQQVVMLPARPEGAEPVGGNEPIAVDNSDEGSPAQAAVDNSDEGSPAQVQPATPPTEDPVMQDTQPVQQETEAVVQEQTPAPPVEQQPTQPAAPIDESDLGMYGQATTNMSGVYTIVLYSLTNESNARAKVSELEQAGLKARLTSLPSSTYGTIWRVSIGHFKVLANAAIAIDELGAPYNDDYFVTKL